MIRNKQALVLLRDLQEALYMQMFSLDDFTVIYIYIDRYLLINDNLRNRPKKKKNPPWFFPGLSFLKTTKGKYSLLICKITCNFWKTGEKDKIILE